MFKIRKNIFETNSSSTHALILQHPFKELKPDITTVNTKSIIMYDDYALSNPYDKLQFFATYFFYNHQYKIELTVDRVKFVYKVLKNIDKSLELNDISQCYIDELDDVTFSTYVYNNQDKLDQIGKFLYDIIFSNFKIYYGWGDEEWKFPFIPFRELDDMCKRYINGERLEQILETYTEGDYQCSEHLRKVNLEL